MTRFITLAEYFWLAEQVTGVDGVTLPEPPGPSFALHPPAAGFGAEDFYPDLPDRAAVLTCRLAWNHPLPAGNKRATWASLVVFMDPNGGRWDPDPPDTDEAEEAMLAVAASEVDEVWFAQWLAARVWFDG